MTSCEEREQNMQTLRLAIAIERHCHQLYLDWAYRFHPYDLGTSIILKELAKEEAEHEQELIEVYTEVTGKKAPTDLLKPDELRGLIQGLQSIQDHYFVINLTMAKTILEMALNIELFTRDFYQQYLKKTQSSQVSTLISRMKEFEDNHAHILMERLARIQISHGEANSPRIGNSVASL